MTSAGIHARLLAGMIRAAIALGLHTVAAPALRRCCCILFSNDCSLGLFCDTYRTGFLVFISAKTSRFLPQELITFRASPSGGYMLAVLSPASSIAVSPIRVNIVMMLISLSVMVLRPRPDCRRRR